MTKTDQKTDQRKGTPRGPRILFLVVVVFLLGVLAGAARAEAPRRELTIFEAASLKDVFARLARRFEADNAGVTVVANPAGSQELRAQIEHGARADVFASADRKHLDALAAQGLVGAPAIFACNEPVLIVRAGFAPPLKTFADLPRVERLVVGAPEVPIGGYTLTILEKAAAPLGADFPSRVQAKIVSRELNVRQILAKVVLGEADAGIVYRSDALTAGGKVRVVEIPRELNVTAEYPIATLTSAPHPELARRFIELARSPAGVAALREAGFAPCAGP
jgi:molybdate transport system substrate-binding protein